MKKVRIAKEYTEKVSIDFQSYLFRTAIEMEVEIESPKDLIRESDQLHKNVFLLTQRDKKSHEDILQPRKIIEKEE